MMSDRMQEIARARKEGNKPTIVSVREILEFATLQGARRRSRKQDRLVDARQLADVIVVNLTDINTLRQR